MTTPDKNLPGIPLNRDATPVEVQDFHKNSDVDASQQAQHHTLGNQHNQSAPGDHNHNGANSRKIGAGLDSGFPSTAGATYSQAQMQSVIDALRDLGLGT